MEPKFQTSFIPKKPILASEGAVRKTVDFFMIISVVIFLASGVLLAGVYTYKFILAKNITNLQSSLAKASDAFEEDFIGEVNRFNTRIETSKDLLGKHVSASAIFGLLAKHTLVTVSYNDFSYLYSSDGTVKIILRGVAQSYASIALQSEEFGKQNQYIKSPIFSDLTPDQNGNISFTLTMLLDKNLISYQKTLSPAVDTGVGSSTNQGNI